MHGEQYVLYSLALQPCRPAVISIVKCNAAFELRGGSKSSMLRAVKRGAGSLYDAAIVLGKFFGLSSADKDLCDFLQALNPRLCPGGTLSSSEAVTAQSASDSPCNTDLHDGLQPPAKQAPHAPLLNGISSQPNSVQPEDAAAPSTRWQQSNKASSSFSFPNKVRDGEDNVAGRDPAHLHSEVRGNSAIAARHGSANHQADKHSSILEPTDVARNIIVKPPSESVGVPFSLATVPALEAADGIDKLIVSEAVLHQVTHSLPEMAASTQSKETDLKVGRWGEELVYCFRKNSARILLAHASANGSQEVLQQTPAESD
ncbi:MAG: hypothetical protein FRX49_11196 [Trebouxia sp. A1-2]|nr:MAG: hypothetical protein FRX49_11196 [Trebouxia sp. A1-2]